MSILALLLFLALALLLACATVALCGSLLYWYERLNSPDARIPSLQVGFFSCLYTYGIILGSYLLCVLALAVNPFFRCRIKYMPGANVKEAAGKTSSRQYRKDIGEPAARAANLPPLILIHGIYNNAGVWLYFRHRLGRASFSCSTFSYRSFFISPKRILQGLEEHVRAIEAAFPGRKPLFICHSLGGLLVRHWLLAHGNHSRAHGVLTLGTPHSGSKVAALGPGKLATQLLPDAAFIRALQDAPLPPCACVSLLSSMDEAVLPASHLLPPQGWRMRLISGASHIAMLFCPRTAAAMLEELDSIVREQGKR